MSTNRPLIIGGIWERLRGCLEMLSKIGILQYSSKLKGGCCGNKVVGAPIIHCLAKLCKLTQACGHGMPQSR